MELLRFITIGDVDDGKSTLIGRLLYDSKSIFDDTLEDVQRSSQKYGQDGINLALLTDGLRSEREQGITIDVAYRFFATRKRKFIIIDAPGHVQYTRNMITGASNASLAIVLVDATKGIQEQTRRHTFISSLLQIRHLVVCVNKMDLVEYSEETFTKICEEFKAFAPKLDLYDVTFIPVSALKGDNVVDKSDQMPWYRGLPLLGHLEEVYVGSDNNLIDFRFPVQGIIRANTGSTSDYRSYTGAIVSGNIQVDDEVSVLPAGVKTRIKSIETYSGSIQEAFAGMSVALQLADEVDVSRGNIISKSGNLPALSSKVEAMVCWVNSAQSAEGSRFVFRHTTNDLKCVLEKIHYKVNINTLHRIEDSQLMNVNDIGKLSLRLSKPAYYDPYKRNRLTGSAILIDEATNQTVAALMIL